MTRHQPSRTAPATAARARAVLALLVLAAPTAPRSATADQVRLRTRLELAPGPIEVAPLRMEGFARSATPAQPALPRRELRVALHPGVVLDSLRLTVRSGPVDTLPGRHALAPNAPFEIGIGRKLHLSWGRAGTVLAGRDLDAYGDGVFPAAPIMQGRVANHRGLRVLHLTYAPLRYRHSRGELLVDRHTEVMIRYAVAGRASTAHLPHRLAPALGDLANPAQARQWYSTRADSAARIGYAIIAPDAIRTASAQLQPFIEHKRALGYHVVVPTEADIAARELPEGADDADRIRAWLQQHYEKDDLQYVLLIGNPDPRRAGVPMKLVHTMEDYVFEPTLTPTDYYFADLTGDWDLDDDGKFAEFDDDNAPGGVDFAPEVYVGRIPVYDGNVAALDRILAKTIAYATARGDLSWRKRVLQPAAMLFYEDQYGQPHYRMDGADTADAIYDQAIKQFGLSRTTLYEVAGVDPSRLPSDLPLTQENVIAEWNRGYGLVTWLGHGSPQGVYRTIWATDDGDGVPSYKEIDSPPFFTYDDTVKLDDTRPAFVFHGSCSNGEPEYADNVGYGLLRHGAVGTVSSTRVAIVSFQTGSVTTTSANIFGVQRDFSRNLLEGMSAGEALFRAKAGISDKLGRLTWFTRLQLSLYGDPSLSLVACASDADCDDGDPCTGAERCDAGQCVAGEQVHCAATDPCMESRCDPSTGQCSAAPRPDDEACEDGLFCTVNDRCSGGVCAGTPRCAAPGNPCASAVCDEQARTCDLYRTDHEGAVCRPGSDRQGICRAGICEPNRSGGALAPVSQAPRGGVPPGLVLLIIAALLRWRPGARHAIEPRKREDHRR